MFLIAEKRRKTRAAVEARKTEPVTSTPASNLVDSSRSIRLEFQGNDGAG